MRVTKTLAPLFSLMLMSCLSLEGQTAPAPDEIETAKEKLAALKKKLPEVLNQCLSNATLWPRKYKGRIAGLRLISPNEAKLTIRLDYVPPENPDAPAVGGAAGGGPGGGGDAGGGPGGRRVVVQNANAVVFIYLKLFDGVWTTHQVGPMSNVQLQGGINYVMAAIDEIADREAGK